MKPLLGFLLIALGLAFALWASLASGSSTSATSTSSSATAPALPVAAAPAPTPRPAPALPAALPPPPQPPPSPERIAEDGVLDRRARLQAQFTAQPIDASWATAASRQLGDDLEKHATPEARVRSVECRSTVCRIEVGPGPREALQQIMQSWARHRTWTGAAFAAAEGDTVVLFVGKPGTELP